MGKNNIGNQKVLPKKSNGELDWSGIIKLAKSALSQEDMPQLTGKPGIEEVVFGKLAPQALALEETVLGSILMDQHCYAKVKAIFGEVNPFYKDTHQLIWKHIVKVCESGITCDRLMLMESIMSDETTKVENSGEIAYYLVQLCEQVSNTINAEYHAQVVLQRYSSRFIIDACIGAVAQLYKPGTHPMQVREALLSTLEGSVAQGRMLEAIDGATLMARAVQAQSASRICGEFFKVGSITMLFAPAKVGKSIFGVMMADALAKGRNLLNNVLINEVGAQTILYFDFELTYSNWKSRYSVDGLQPYEFSKENFWRVGEKQDFSDYGSFSKYVLGEIRIQVATRKPHSIFIDNITYMTDGSIQPEMATNIMKYLKSLNKKYGINVVVLAHTPKMDKKLPITEDTMAGSAQLKNFCTDIIGLAPSFKEEGTVYLKQLVCRDGKVVYGSENTIWMKIKKENNFLGMEFLGFVDEMEHKIGIDEALEQEDMIREAVRLETTMSVRDIVKQLKLPFSYGTLHRKMAAFKKKQGEVEPDKSEAEKWNDALNATKIPDELSLIPKGGDFESGERDKEFESKQHFEECVKTYFEAIKSTVNQNIELNFIKGRKKNVTAFVQRGRNVINIYSDYYYEQLQNGELWSAYKDEATIQRRRGIRKQYRVMWTLCHETLHILEPNMEHGKDFAQRVELLYNKVMLRLKTN